MITLKRYSDGDYCSRFVGSHILDFTPPKNLKNPRNSAMFIEVKCKMNRSHLKWTPIFFPR